MEYGFVSRHPPPTVLRALPIDLEYFWQTAIYDTIARIPQMRLVAPPGQPYPDAKPPDINLEAIAQKPGDPSVYLTLFNQRVDPTDRSYKIDYPAYRWIASTLTAYLCNLPNSSLFARVDRNPEVQRHMQILAIIKRGRGFSCFSLSGETWTDLYMRKLFYSEVILQGFPPYDIVQYMYIVKAEVEELVEMVETKRPSARLVEEERLRASAQAQGQAQAQAGSRAPRPWSPPVLRSNY